MAKTHAMRREEKDRIPIDLVERPLCGVAYSTCYESNSIVHISATDDLVNCPKCLDILKSPPPSGVHLFQTKIWHRGYGPSYYHTRCAGVLLLEDKDIHWTEDRSKVTCPKCVRFVKEERKVAALASMIFFGVFTYKEFLQAVYQDKNRFVSYSNIKDL